MGWYEEMEQAEQEYDVKLENEALEYKRGYEQGRADREKELSELPNEYSDKLWKIAYERGRANERAKIMNTLNMLINGDYDSRECKLLYSDFCEFLEEQDN